MIGKLKGTVDSIYKSTIILDVSGVGYRIAVPSRTLVKFTEKGKELSLYVHTYVRQDTFALYGFETQEELALFERLLSISGIGAKIALAVCSSGSVEEITKAVINNDVEFLCAVPGIGKKSAQRLIVDLKTSLIDTKELEAIVSESPTYNETVEALKQFGFSSAEAKSALRSIEDKAKYTTEELLREVLKILGK